MQVRVALISKPDPELQMLKAQLRNPLFFQVRDFLSLEAVGRELSDYPCDVLLMRVPHFAVNHVEMIERVRRRFADASLITSAPEIHPTARYQARKISGHTLLEEPTETDDLVKVIEKMRRIDASAARLHARTRREGQAEIIDGAGRRMMARFVDFAQMGARVVVRSTERIYRDARIELHYESSTEPGRVHKLLSRVVWEGATGGMVDSIFNGPSQVLGLRFVAAL